MQQTMRLLNTKQRGFKTVFAIVTLFTPIFLAVPVYAQNPEHIKQLLDTNKVLTHLPHPNCHTSSKASKVVHKN
ncbi:hypothetical protein Nos7524_2210 [Nostoc sp. PCC 7524]|nr:hypothetical protein Nos7524_2210 [Nostoc sp. PCC 7524]